MNSTQPHTLKSLCDQVHRMRLAHTRIDDLLDQIGKTPHRKVDPLLGSLRTVCIMAKQLEQEVDKSLEEISIQHNHPPPPPEIPAERKLSSHVWNGPSEQL